MKIIFTLKITLTASSTNIISVDYCEETELDVGSNELLSAKHDTAS